MKKLKLFMASLPISSLAIGGILTVVLGLSTMQPVAAQLGGGGQDLSISTGATAAKGNDQPEELGGERGMFKRITDVMLFIVGAISVIMLIIGGIRYVVSGGDQGAVQSAKNTILYAIVGVIVTILAYAVVNFVISQFASNQ